ncbi:metal ABC transporter solute-binding protein, Zn/Mn family [Nocardia pseudobrasiliensis]|uniref:Zinc/manganese transport system substrate-binding protein n=1 Tax=Nocardia pseudobrasiliensis TaxID=45979 RepID=A0A370I9P6_9NOCA|nr:zinc ABC transporter substrate-binding protein [Nocardia pseudobrasiliensis]RDI66114.1 zinc/manganese transport system substrate-binding protein [Nocardia pseudobrasiliensis]
MTRSYVVRSAAAALGIASAAALAGCGGSTGESGGHTVVASTSAWGSVAAAVAGPDMTVESIISKPTDDPHEYQTNPSDAAKLRDAALVIVNGGHYDEFAEKAVEGRGKPTVNAFDLRTGAAKSDDNEHIWYDVNTVGAVADKIAAELGAIDPDHARGYTDRASAFRAKLAEITAVTARIAAEHPKSPVLQTEPIAHYLLLAADAEDRTPHAFEEAIEQGTDPAPADVAAVRDLLSGKRVRALVYNKQTEDKATRELAAVARAAGVAVVEVTETLPVDTDYLRWQIDNAQALAKALG